MFRSASDVLFHSIEAVDTEPQIHWNKCVFFLFHLGYLLYGICGKWQRSLNKWPVGIFPTFDTSNVEMKSSIYHALDPVPVQMLSPELFCFSQGPSSTEIS